MESDNIPLHSVQRSSESYCGLGRLDSRRCAAIIRGLDSKLEEVAYINSMGVSIRGSHTVGMSSSLLAGVASRLAFCC